ncbi:MAG TPA: DinB family protein [Pyrinomonadaceae bacterium]|nr:DinB family protein [Pyrinomonadaceae bacterium]
MLRPETNEYNPGYQKYFDRIPAGEFLELLKTNEQRTSEFFESIPESKHAYRYAEGKWSIKELVMHMIDTERVFAGRALAAARGESETPFYRMDEELYARHVDVSNRNMLDLVSEFRAVRKSTEYLFQHMNEEESGRWCNVVTHPMTARAIGYFLIGHVEHHVGVVKERYLA